MPHAASDRRTDIACWAAAAGLAVTAAAVVGTAKRSADTPPVAASAHLHTQSAVVPRSEPGPDRGAEARSAAFHQRLVLLAPLQAALARVFLAASPPATGGRDVARERVRPAQSPQACLAQAVYYEARGEPAEGQAAVAQVVLNRTRSGRHPADVCGTVFEGAARRGCQFSFACDAGLARRALEPAAWRQSQQVAAEVIAGRGPAGLSTTLNYHAHSVRPRWAAQLERTAEIGRHIFYGSAISAGRAVAGWAVSAPPPSSGA